MNELEEKILQIIRDVYKKEYIGKIKVTKLQDQDSYILRLYMNYYDFAPIIIAADVKNAEDFLEFVRKELSSRQLIQAKFFKVVRADDQRRNCGKN